jgi:predicted RNA-binding protein with RPS1 domain
MKDYIAHSPESKEILAISELIKASTAAIDTLNKINLSEKKNQNAKEIKKMDIESKKELKNTENESRMTFTREEILKQLMQSSVSIESVTVDAKKSEPYPKLAGS